MGWACTTRVGIFRKVSSPRDVVLPKVRRQDLTPKTSHTLRHSFATDLYRETTNIRLTQKALGHSNLAATQIYTHIVDEELEGALKSFRCATITA